MIYHNPMRFVGRNRLLAVGFALVVSTLRVAHADQVVTTSENHVGARVIVFEDGQLRFRTADGQLNTVWPNQLSLVIIDRGGAFDDFNQAERFVASGEPERAIVRYRRALGLSEGFWSDLINARTLLACDAAGQLDRATTKFIDVLEGRWAGPAAAARLLPTSIPNHREGKVVRALERLDSALRKAPEDEERALLELLRYEILRQSGDSRALRAAERVATLSIPPAARSELVFSILLDGMGKALDRSVSDESLSALDSAIRDCPESILPSFLLLKGRVQLGLASNREEAIRAAWAFMRVAIHYRDDPRAADGLYGAALSLDRIGRTDKAVELLEECLGCGRLTIQTRQSARELLQRLRTSSGSGD